MTKETQEYIHNTAVELVLEMLEITDRAILAPDEEAWRDKAGNWLGYTAQHYKPEKVIEV